MAILCAHCGKTLPRDDARFCNNCGMLNPNHLLDAQLLGIETGSLVPLNAEADPPHEPVRRAEQALPQAFAYGRPDESPAWMSNLGKNSLYNKSDKGLLPDQSVASAAHLQISSDGITSIASSGETSSNKEEAVSAKEALPAFPTTLRPKTPVKELRIKVWDHLDDGRAGEVEENSPKAEGASIQVPSQQEPLAEQFDAEDDVDYLPTQPLPAHLARSGMSENSSIDDQPTLPLPLNAMQQQDVGSQDDKRIEQLDTVHMVAQSLDKVTPIPPVSQRPDFTVVRENTPAPVITVHRWERAQESPGGYEVAPPAVGQPEQLPVTTLPLPAVATVAPTPARTSSARPWGRMPLFILLIVMMLLVAGGVGAWIIFYQPFSVNPVTNPLQSFQDEKLRLSLLYPREWLQQVDHAKAHIHLSDSSNTDQIDISLSDASTTDIDQYLQQQAKQLNISNAKVGTPVTFGGVSWQQLQGSAQVNGANYTETLFATVHSNHLYLIAQSAPQVTYGDEETAVFSAIRTSWQFL